MVLKLTYFVCLISVTQVISEYVSRFSVNKFCNHNLTVTSILSVIRLFFRVFANERGYCVSKDVYCPKTKRNNYDELKSEYLRFITLVGEGNIVTIIESELYFVCEFIDTLNEK